MKEPKKEKYQEIEIEIIRFKDNDIITNSGLEEGEETD